MKGVKMELTWENVKTLIDDYLDGKTIVCEVKHYRKLEKQRDDLLEACESLCNVLELQSDELQNAAIAHLPEYNYARQSIAKAKEGV